MQNLTLVANSALGGNIVTILVRQLIMRKARQAAKAFKARISDLQQQSGEMDYQAPDVCIGVIPISTKKNTAGNGKPGRLRIYPGIYSNFCYIQIY